MKDLAVLVSEQEIMKRCVELGNEISKAYEGKTIYVISVLTGGVFFTVELTKHIDRSIIFNFVSASSYNNSTVSSGNVNISFDLKYDIEGKDVLIIEDIIDSGRTLHTLKEIVMSQKPSSIKICTMLDKPSRREIDVNVDFVGFEIEDKFVVGYGLDNLDGTMRNLPYIGVIEQ